MKKLLLLSGKDFETQFVLAAQKMGYYVVTTGNNPNHSAHKYSDEYIPFDNTDYDGMMELVKREKIDAICQGCTDRCALIASYIGEKLGLKGHDNLEAAQIIHHKDKFKKFTKEHNIISPKAFYYDSVNAAICERHKHVFPVIVKPVDLGGGQGISVIQSEEEYMDAVYRAFESSGVGRIVIEEYIEGTLHSMSTFLVRQKVVSYGTADDFSFKNMYMTNTGCFPATHPKEIDEILIREVEKIASILKLVDGLLHFQYIVDKEGKPWIIEMMRRSPGNKFLASLSNSVGMEWVDWIIRAEAGENCTFVPASHRPDRYYGYHSVMANNNGVYKGIQVDKEFEKYIFEVNEFKNRKVKINDYMNEKFGSILFCFPTRKEREVYLPKINKCVYAISEDEEYE